MGMARRDGPGRRTGRGATVLVAGTVLLAGCGSDTPRVTEARGHPESTRLVVSGDTCNAHPSASVEESDRQVRVLLRASRSWGDADCAATVVITLASPRGTRAVVDGATDERVEVLPLRD